MIMPGEPTTSAPTDTPEPQDDRRFVLAVVRRILRDEDAAADVAQDALLTAFRYRDAFRGEARYRTWLYRVATTAALSYLRRQRARARRVASLEELSAVGAAPVTDRSPSTPAQRLASAQTAAAVSRAFEQLPTPYRRVLELRLCDGLSTQETARTLGISVATVKIRTFRGRLRMQSLLGDAEASAAALSRPAA
ncbi:MAG: RNA polymerase sigma factor [Kofleriaceae bacterium]